MPSNMGAVNVIVQIQPIPAAALPVLQASHDNRYKKDYAIRRETERSSWLTQASHVRETHTAKCDQLAYIQ